LLTSPTSAVAIAHKLADLGFLGTVGSDTLYDPANPSIAPGVTALTTIAPYEANTAAIKRMTVDVHAFKSDQVLTPAVAAGYWSADLFLAILRRVGRQLTVARFQRAANASGFRYAVPDTVGGSSWPAMHAQGIPCGALVQNDGTQYFVAEAYRCGRTIPVRPRR
jgi:hypothetical protein